MIINLKQTLCEGRGDSASLGCLMAMIMPPHKEMISEFSRRIIPDEKLYFEGEEFGREDESHITIKYGFTKDLNELELRKILKDQPPFLVELNELNKFENDMFDVVILKAESSVLRELNRRCNDYPHEDTYRNYNPHMTLAYVRKGEFPHVKENLNIVVPIKMICYSPIQGDKTFYNL